MGKQNRESTPASVKVRKEPRRHTSDPTLGTGDVDVDRNGQPPNRLVTIGDSITQGFMSGAVFRTDRSWPALVAHELGLKPGTEFRFPVYEPPSGPGGLPLDLERAIRGLGEVVGERLDWHELVRAGLWLRRYMDRIEDFWEGRSDPHHVLPERNRPYHNLAVYGADLVDVQVLNQEIISSRFGERPKDNFLAQVVEHDNDLAWQVVLNSAGSTRSTVIDAATAMGEEGTASHGIETLVVMLGANNALGSVLSLEPHWTTDNYVQSSSLDERLELKKSFNVWQPAHFADEWERLVAKICGIRARHVIFATVPQVTIAPIARGVRGKTRHGSRFYPHYTRPWIGDEDFDPRHDPYIDEDQARGIDSAIDAFNATIIDSVRAARQDSDDPKDWYVFDLGALLDRMASKRYVSDPLTRPEWWTPYELPPEVAALRPVPDTKFFTSNKSGRVQGGLFSLDGVHPTTTAAGVIAREVIRIMDRYAGVSFAPDVAGNDRSRGTVDVDFDRVLTLDTLNSDPPAAIASTLAVLGWFDEQLDWVRRITGFSTV
jgi:hypothetical protein